MLELFANPLNMIIGAALISSPIIIHLINRMRFKRIRWAAMEFLLKSQKRNRRRLIIEQLILLALRILLVLLAAFLVARFIYAGGARGQQVTHVVVLDDTLSMTDRSGEARQATTAFDSAREQVVLLAKTAVQAPTSQNMQVYLLSDLEQPIFDKTLKDRTVDDLVGVL